jgi:hypothetical protein
MDQQREYDHLNHVNFIVGMMLCEIPRDENFEREAHRLYASIGDAMETYLKIGKANYVSEVDCISASGPLS